MKWTNEQLQAINDSGENIIVSAGAGSGKTAVLTQRVITKLKKGININNLLILTFTNAAAAEMKERIRNAIEKDPELSYQLDYIDSSYITTFDSFALSIVKKYLPEDLEIKSRHFPMSNDSIEKVQVWNNVSEEIVSDVKSGKDVGFVTLGDPMIYSTYVYVMERLMEDIEVETIPGISSFSNIASNHNYPLVMDTDPLMVIPCTMEEEKIDEALEKYDCFVLMKVYKRINTILEKLEKHDLIDHAILVSNSSQEEEEVITNLRDYKIDDKISYFSTILVNKNRNTR